jgi:hypothetical protein
MTTAQILRITPDEYHKRPGLSSSIASILVEQSPLHARAAHPMFGGESEGHTKATARGSVCHTLALGKGARYEVLDFEDFKTKDARAARDAATAAGLVPILKDAHDEAIIIVARATENLRRRGIEFDGESELVIEWYESSPSGPVLCRCMLDHSWIGGGAARILDLKFVGNAAPAAVERSAENFGYAVQAAAYRRAVTALDPGLAGRVDFLFAFAEVEKPYEMNLSRPDGTFRELGERRWIRAVEAWGACLLTDKWPGYGSGVNTLSPPAWAMAREEFAA